MPSLRHNPAFQEAARSRNTELADAGEADRAGQVLKNVCGGSGLAPSPPMR